MASTSTPYFTPINTPTPVWEGTSPQPSQHQPLHPAFLAEPIVRSVNNAVAPPPAAQGPSAQAHDKAPLKRTPGMKLFDFFLYPVLTNLAVFAISVVATYQTTYGEPWGIKAPKPLVGLHNNVANTPLKYLTKPLLATFKILEGNPFKDRGDYFRAKAKPLLGEAGARAAIMLLFSFADGSLMAPVVKLFEDRRGKISQKLDAAMGTTPTDKRIYDTEPKQSWASVLGGRATVVPIILTALVLLNQRIEKLPGAFPALKAMGITHLFKKGGVDVTPSNSFNDLAFSKPGLIAGEWLERTLPSIPKQFPKVKIPGLFEIMFFEFFYTSLCTAGLYGISRFYASGKVQPTVDAIKQNLQAYPAQHAFAANKQHRPLAAQA